MLDLLVLQLRDVLLQRTDPILCVYFDNGREKYVYLNGELHPLFPFWELSELELQKSRERWSSRHSPGHQDWALIDSLFPIPLRFFPSLLSCPCLAQTGKFYAL